MKRLNIFYKTEEHLTGFILRVTLALVVLPHGCQLLLGWFGGYGFTNTMNYFTQTEGLPWIIGFMVIMLQFFGSLMILFGVFVRLLSFSMIALFIGMIVTSHLEHGFFMNWAGNQTGEGFEFHLLVIGLALALLINGAGAYSVDAWITSKAKKDEPYFNLNNISL